MVTAGVVFTSSVFGLTVPELGVAAVGVAYVISLLKDWRPVKTLRAENRELRGMLEAAEKKIVTLESQVEVLQKETNLSALVDEHKKIANVLDRVVKKLDDLDSAVHANTAAIETVARGSAMTQAINDMKGDTK